jgi:hypothetical protein
MSAAVVPQPPAPGPKVFTDDPVLVSWVIFTAVQGIVAVLLLAEVLSEKWGGIIIGVIAVAYAAVSQLFVRPATVPREPLQELADAASGTNP